MSFADDLLKGELILQTVTPGVAAAVGFFNPALGLLLTEYGPIAESWVIKETSILINLNTNMTKEQMIAALEKSKSANWNVQPLETPGDVKG
jgi:hypothetical protein